MPHPQRSLFANALIVVAMRWTDRLIGLVSTLILARILTPEDFGIIAMAS
ncbi:MAG: oligosaccharide flippase family protein, partial [Zoogloea sp.]|nr:oligosaccharide flippase family protein [Zoogloea sp.]